MQRRREKKQTEIETRTEIIINVHPYILSRNVRNYKCSICKLPINSSAKQNILLDFKISYCGSLRRRQAGVNSHLAVQVNKVPLEVMGKNISLQ